MPCRNGITQRMDSPSFFIARYDPNATWRGVGNRFTEAALLAGGVSAAPILVGMAGMVHTLTASLTTRVELFRDVIQLSSIAVAIVKQELSPFFEAIRGWTQFLIVDFSFIAIPTIHALTDVAQFVTCLVAFYLLRKAVRKDADVERDGLETTSFERQGKMAVKWRYTLAQILTSLYLPASARALNYVMFLHYNSNKEDRTGPDGSGSYSTDGGAFHVDGTPSHAFVVFATIGFVLCFFVLISVTLGFPFVMYRIIRDAVPPPVEFDSEGNPVEEDDLTFAQTVSKSRNPYTFIFSDLRRHAATLPVYNMVYKFALSFLTVFVMPLVHPFALWIPQTIFILLCIGSTAVFYRLRPYHDRKANLVAMINQAIVSANAIVAGFTSANVWGGGAGAALILTLQIISIALNSSLNAFNSDAIRRKLRNAFGVARLSINDDDEYMVLDPATDFFEEVHKRLWQPALDRLFYFGEGLALPKVAKVNEQVIKHEQGMYDASEDKQTRSVAKGSDGGDGVETRGPAEEEGEDTESSAREDDEDEDEDEDDPVAGCFSFCDAAEKGQSLLNKASGALFRRKRRKDDPLSDCGILDIQGCPSYLLNFRGTVGERHYENKKILESVGESRYAAELRRLSEGLSAEEQERDRLVWTQFSAVDMYWQAPGAQRKGTGFGKAVVIPFPMCVLFQFDDGSSEEVPSSAVAHFISGNQDAEIQRRRDVRLQIRCLRGEMCYFFYQEWRTKTKTRQKMEWVYEGGQRVRRTTTERYNVQVQITFEKGRLDIGTISKPAKWKGFNVAAGFNVTLYYADGHGVDNEGEGWSGERTTIGHDTLGITPEFAMTAELNRLLSKSMDTVRSNRPDVDRFWTACRQYYYDVAEHKKRVLSYDFLLRVFKDRSLMYSNARDRLESGMREEPNEAVKSVPDRFDAFLSDLYSAVSGVLVAGKRSAAWFTFWHDFWTMNCDLSRVQEQADLLNPLYRTSMAAMYSTYADDRAGLEQTLCEAKLRSENGSGGFFRDSVLEVLWQAMDRADEEDGNAGSRGNDGTPAQGNEETKGEDSYPVARRLRQ